LPYLEHCESFNSKGWYNAKRYLGSKYFIKWFERPLDSLTPAEIEKHLIERRALSARSANLDFEILRHFFGWCIDMEFLVKSPMRPLRKFPLTKKNKVIPESNVVRALIDCNTGTDRLLILLLVYTMARISEIKGLKWEDINFKDSVLYLKTRKTRDGSEKIREIPIGGELLDSLLSVRQEKGFVLQYQLRGRGYPYRDLRKKLKACCRNADVTLQSGFHQFRHYGATHLADRGAPLNVIQDLLGHTSLDTTSLYLQSLRESKRKAMELL